MKLATPCLVAVAAVFGAVGLAAQAKPNFSGTWIAVGPQQGIQELTIKHDDSTLSLEGQPDVAKRTFKLDGSGAGSRKRQQDRSSSGARRLRPTPVNRKNFLC